MINNACQMNEWIDAPSNNRSWASLVAQRLKSLPPMQKTQVRSLGREDPLEKEMVTHSSILAWRIPWMEKPGRLQSMGSQRVRHDWATSLCMIFLCFGKKSLLRSEDRNLRLEGLHLFPHCCPSLPRLLPWGTWQPMIHQLAKEVPGFLFKLSTSH